MGWHPYFLDLCQNENKAQRFVKIPDAFFRRRCCRLLRARKILHAWTEKAAKQGGKKERAQQEKRMGKNTKPQNRMQSSCTLSHVCWDISIRNELEIIFFWFCLSGKHSFDDSRAENIKNYPHWVWVRGPAVDMPQLSGLHSIIMNYSENPKHALWLNVLICVADQVCSITWIHYVGLFQNPSLMLKTKTHDNLSFGILTPWPEI